MTTSDSIGSIPADLRPLLPRWGRRVQARGAYRSADRTAWESGWTSREDSPDSDLSGDLEILRARGQDLTRNSGYLQCAEQTIIEGVLGDGLRPAPRGPRADLIADLWSTWETIACADGDTSWVEWETQILSSCIASGDVLAIWPMSRDSSGWIGLRVDAIDAARVVSPMGTDTTGNVRHGVVYDDRGRVRGYLVASDETAARGSRRDDLQYWPRDIDGLPNARLVSHPGHRRPRQSRQVPLFAPVLLRAKDLDSLVRAEVRSANTRSRLTGVLTAPDPTLIAQQITARSQHADAYSQVAGAYNQTRVGQIGDAQILSLAIGESLQLHTPQTTNSVLAAFADSVLREIAGPTNIPHRVLFRILGDANYSSARSDLLVARRVFRRWRAGLIRRCLQPTYERFVREAWTIGLLGRAPLSPEEMAPEWTPPRDEWIDPSREAAGWREMLEMGLTSVPRLVRELGGDAYDIAAEQSEWERTTGRVSVQVPAGATTSTPGLRTREPDENKGDDDDD